MIRIVTMVMLKSKTPAVYIHNSNRFTRRIGEKTTLLKTDGKSQPYFITLSHCGFLHCGNSTSRMRRAYPLHFSLTTFLQGKQRLTNQKFVHIKLQEKKKLKKTSLLHKYGCLYNNSYSTKNPIQMK